MMTNGPWWEQHWSQRYDGPEMAAALAVHDAEQVALVVVVVGAPDGADATFAGGRERDAVRDDGQRDGGLDPFLGFSQIKPDSLGVAGN